MKKFCLYLGALLIAFTPSAYGDSPVTSTNIWHAYRDQTVVQLAHAQGKLTLKLSQYLANPTHSLEFKVGLINALYQKSWKQRNHAGTFRAYLARTSALPKNKTNLKQYRPVHLFCLGHLTLLDNYRHPEKALPLLLTAHQKLSRSFTATMIVTLAKCQYFFNRSWGTVWNLFQTTMENRTLTRDMRPQAIKEIAHYLRLYQQYSKVRTNPQLLRQKVNRAHRILRRELKASPGSQAF